MADSLALLPWHLAAEELETSQSRTIEIGGLPQQLTDFQNTFWKQLNSGLPIAVSAPTSAGKSFVLQAYLVSDGIGSDDKTIVYLVPTRALIAQVSEDLEKQFSHQKTRPKVITIPIEGDEELPPNAIFVMTQERVQLMLTAHPDFSANVIVVDEAHSIGEGSRGVLLQWVIDDLLRRKPAAQVLFASPNIRNLDVFGRLFGIPDVVELKSAEPTVAQNFLVVEIISAKKGEVEVSIAGEGGVAPKKISRLKIDHTLAGRAERLVYLSAIIGNGQANIVYANGAADAEDMAMKLAEYFDSRETTKQRESLAKLAGEIVHDKYVLSNCLRKGIGFHYSFMPTLMRTAIEDAFDAGIIDYLVCTSTLLQGVNLPAKNIFMCMPEKGRLRPLESTDFWNLAGRAGRLRREFQGNIFLIDYDHWKKLPLEGPRQAEVVPAIESTIRDREHKLIDVISSGTSPVGRQDQPDLESAFVRLYSDYKRGELFATLDRAGFASDTRVAVSLATALEAADVSISIPPKVLRETPNVSAHKQQRLHDFLRAKIEAGDKAAIQNLVPSHPRDPEAYYSYEKILALCHEVILGLDTAKGLHKFHAVMAHKWMLGLPLPRIIEDQLKRHPSKSSRLVIRDTLETIESKIRFQTVRLFGCYSSLLSYALLNANMLDVLDSIPSVPLFLEVGASDKSMISFISLGLSRLTSMKLNEASLDKNLDAAAALEWLRRRDLDQLGLSQLLVGEIRAVLTRHE